MQVDLLGFYRISNAIGGVRVCLLHAQNAQTDSDAFGSGYSGINLPAGWSTIKGTQALAFVRQRHGLPNGDLDRIKRQQYFLSAAFKKISTSGQLLNPFELHSLLSAVSSSLITDPALNLVSLAGQFADLSSGQHHLRDDPERRPADDLPRRRRDLDRRPRHRRAARLHRLPARQAGRPGARDGDRRQPVRRDRRRAQRHRHHRARRPQLRPRSRRPGSRSTPSTAPRPRAQTLIQYPAGPAGPGQGASAPRCPGAQLTLTSTVTRVTLVLGANGVQAKGTVSDDPVPRRRRHSSPAAATPARQARRPHRPTASTSRGGLGRSPRFGPVTWLNVSDWQPPGGGPQPPHEPLPPISTRAAGGPRMPASGDQRPPTGAGGRSRSGRRDIARGALLGTKIVAALLSLTVVIGSYWVWSTWNELHQQHRHRRQDRAARDDGRERQLDDQGQGHRRPRPEHPDPGQRQPRRRHHGRTAALGTQDDGGSSNTDTMMLMHVPGNGKNATIISFPRDS